MNRDESRIITTLLVPLTPPVVKKARNKDIWGGGYKYVTWDMGIVRGYTCYVTFSKGPPMNSHGGVTLGGRNCNISPWGSQNMIPSTPIPTPLPYPTIIYHPLSPFHWEFNNIIFFSGHQCRTQHILEMLERYG